MYIYISISLSLSLSPGSDPWQGYKGFRVPNGTDHEGAMASSTHPSSSWCCFCGLTREFQIKGTLLQDSPKTILFQGHLNSPTPRWPPLTFKPRGEMVLPAFAIRDQRAFMFSTRPVRDDGWFCSSLVHLRCDSCSRSCMCDGRSRRVHQRSLQVFLL